MTGWDALSWEAKRGAVLAQALFTCEMCNDADAVEVDHIWPRSDGGCDARWNLRAACRACNARKGDKIYSGDIDEQPALLIQGIEYGLRRAEESLVQAVHWATVLRLVEHGDNCADAEVRISREWLSGVARVDLRDCMESVSGRLHQAVMENGHIEVVR